jgi:hypothetical protein
MTSEASGENGSITFRLKPYYSYSDEKSFFTWLESIEGVRSIKGTPQGLHVAFDAPFLSRAGAYDLIALFSRYGHPLAPIRSLINPVDVAFFENQEGYWFGELYGDKQAGRRTDQDD